MSRRVKKYVYIMPLVLLWLIFMAYALSLGQWTALLWLPVAVLGGIGVAAIRLKYNLFF